MFYGKNDFGQILLRQIKKVRVWGKEAEKNDQKAIPK